MMSIFRKCGIKNCFWNYWLAWSVFWLKCLVCCNGSVAEVTRWGRWVKYQPSATPVCVIRDNELQPHFLALQQLSGTLVVCFFISLQKLVCLTVDPLFSVFVWSCRVLKLDGLYWKQVEIISLRLFFKYSF